MLKKLKNSFIFICLISLLTGCVNQNQEVQTNEEVTIAATSVSITEILDQLDVPAKQVVGIPQSDSYSVPKKYNSIRECNVTRYGKTFYIKTRSYFKS
jgi:iron complex transport system substrate-binding protein